MSVVCQDGFDFYNGTGANLGIQTRWGLGTTGGGTVSMVAGRFGGQGVRLAPFSIGRTVISRFLPVYPGSHASVTAAAAFRFATVTTNDFLWLCKDGSGSAQVVLRLGAGGQIHAYRGDDGTVQHGGVTFLGSSAAG